jgi:hypothetical protein
MRRPRVRIWMMMVAVALAAPFLSVAPQIIQRRRVQLDDLANYHREHAGGPIYNRGDEESIAHYRLIVKEVRELSAARRKWHRELANKYSKAVRVPWRPVWPDPPQPK